MKYLLVAVILFMGQLQGEDEVGYTIVNRPGMTVMGIECRASNANSQEILSHWAKFFSENIIPQIPNKASDEIIALYCDYESDFNGEYSFVLGCPVTSPTDIPQGMSIKVIPTATYARFDAIGEYPDSLIKTWNRVWKTDLNRTYTGDFEVYGEKYQNTPQEVNVYIAIEQ